MQPLTERDREILEVLTHRVRLLTLPQIARTWWSGRHAFQGARRRLEDLEARGWVQRFAVRAHPELPLLQPVYVWTPGQSVPNFGALSYQLVSRWIEPHTSVAAVIATRDAGVSFGGHGGKRPKRVEENHDVHLAAVFLRLRATFPQLAKCWHSEESIRRSRPDGPGEKLPDAIVRFNGAHKVVDFGGEYSAQKLQAFHRWASRKKFTYEFW